VYVRVFACVCVCVRVFACVYACVRVCDYVCVKEREKEVQTAIHGEREREFAHLKENVCLCLSIKIEYHLSVVI